MAEKDMRGHRQTQRTQSEIETKGRDTHIHAKRYTDTHRHDKENEIQRGTDTQRDKQRDLCRHAHKDAQRH